MSNLLLANVDYQKHMSSEGDQFQRGLESAGWILAGKGFGDGCADVPELIRRHSPSMVIVHDKRDWDTGSGIAFRDDLGFTGLEYLATRSDIFRAVVIKDAAGWLDYHEAFAVQVRAQVLIVYYHPQVVRLVAPWTRHYAMLRTFHSVDPLELPALAEEPRSPVLVSGARGRCYPIRERAFRIALARSWDAFPHPGYSNRGTSTARYLEIVSGHRVSIATASCYGFALRKIFEAVACGATPVTDLPSFDVLPAIDSALVRIPSAANSAELEAGVNRAIGSWNWPERLAWAEAARAEYDYREQGRKLDLAMRRARATCPC